MRVNTAEVTCCHRCGNAIDRAVREVQGRKIEARPKFCRKCGNQIAAPEVVPLERANIDSDTPDEKSRGDELRDFKLLEEAITEAVPDNYKELPVAELRRQIIESLRKRYTEIFPFRTPEQAITDEFPESRQQSVNDSSPSGKLRSTSRPLPNNCQKSATQQYHQVWVNGLIRHLVETSEEMKILRSQLGRNYYTIEPCDCDQVKYVPDEAHPGFLRKVQES